MPSKLLFAALLGAVAVPAALWIVNSDTTEGSRVETGASVASPASDAATHRAETTPRPAPRNLSAGQRPPRQTPRRESPASDATASAAVLETAAGAKDADMAAASDAEDTLYLTIVGDKTYMERGSVEAGPPSLAELEEFTPVASGSVYGAYTGETSTSTAANSATRSANRVASVGAATQTRSAAPGRAQSSPSTNAGANATTRSNSATDSNTNSGNDAGGSATSPTDFPTWVDDREWPNPSCPWTLPAGSSQSSADTLSAQYGCRYLASCSVATQECTYYYQGA